MPIPPRVQLHIDNHKVPRQAQQAYFLIVPPIPRINYSLETLRCGIDVDRRHENSVDTLGPLYCKTWSVAAEDLQSALENIDKHLYVDRRSQTTIVVAILAHVNVKRKRYCWGGSEISLQSVLRWALSCSSVKVVLTLGCSTALPTRLVPSLHGKAVIAVKEPVSYNHLWLFLQNYLQAFRQFTRQGSSFHVPTISMDALNAASNSELTRNKLCQYS